MKPVDRSSCVLACAAVLAACQQTPTPEAPAPAEEAPAASHWEVGVLFSD